MIRPAIAEDIVTIARLIRGLAEYERLSEQVVLDEDELREANARGHEASFVRGSARTRTETTVRAAAMRSDYAARSDAASE